MKNRLIAATLASLAALLTVAPALAAPHAWPDQPPDRATISGPGITGVVEITDHDSLASLRLGSIEDFGAGFVAAPDVGEGYTITRWFYDGTFNFGVLHYYPDPAGGPGYIYFEDGPDVDGGHSPFNARWMRATPAGDAAMRTLLADLGAVTHQPNPPERSLGAVGLPALVLPALLGLCIALVLGAGVALRRRREAGQRVRP